MNIGYIIPYSTAYDGLAEYAREMAKQLEPFAQIIPIPVVDENEPVSASESGVVIRKNRLDDYINAAYYVNRHCQVCLIHYSCQGYGMDKGMAVLAFTGTLTVPSAVIVHNLSGNPDETTRKVLEGMGNHVTHVVAMTQQSADVLTHLCKVSGDKIRVIEYGLPLFDIPPRDVVRKTMGYEGKKVIFAHGMLCENKGLHVLIEAVSMIRLKHSNVMLHIIGHTHPLEFESDGDRYLTGLRLQIRRAGLEDVVIIEHRVPGQEELNYFLSACDVYVNPCNSELTIQSKSLAEAIVAGAAIVSTSTIYARELLSDHRGELVAVNNPLALADAVSQVLNKPNTLDMMRKSSRDFRSIFMWSRIAGRFHKMLDDMCQDTLSGSISRKIIDLSMIPSWNSSYLLQSGWDKTSASSVGNKKVPEDRPQVESHAMAVMGLLKLYTHQPSGELLEHLNRHLTQIRDLQTIEGSFHNDKTCDEGQPRVVVSDEVTGMVFSVLAQVVVDAPWIEQRQLAAEMLKNTMPVIISSTSVNCISASLIGLCIYLQKHPDDSLQVQASEMAQRLVAMFKTHAVEDWYWCDEKMGHMPGLVLLALWFARDVLKVKVSKELLDKTMAFLEQVMFTEDFFFPAGTKRPLRRGRPKAEFDQSAWDAVSMIWLYDYLLKKQLSDKHLKRLFACYLWFLGENSMRRPLYNHRSGGCAHLLAPGMQSIHITYSGSLAYLLSWAMTNEAGCRQYMA